MKIRKIRESDIGDMVKVIHKVMGSSDARAAFADLKDTMQEKENSVFKFEDFYVVEIDRKIVGGGGVWALKHDPYVARLDWFIIDPGYQRKGIGTMLIKFFEKLLRERKAKLILAETSSNLTYKAAATFWAKNGFKEVARIPKYWEDGSACLLYVKRL